MKSTALLLATVAAFSCFNMSISATPVNVALGKPVSADSIFSAAYPPENAVDGNTTSDASRWLSGSGALPHWIEIDLGQTYSLSQLKFWTGKAGVGPYPLHDFALQYWNGTAWQSRFRNGQHVC